MSVIKNINSVNVCTLGNKGVDLICAALDSLTKKDRKKTAKKTTEKRQNELKLLKEKEVFKKTE